MTYYKSTDGVGVTGSVTEFDDSWKQFVRETAQNYFTGGKVVKQIQQSFKNQWSLYELFMKKAGITGGKVLEAGSGRGSISLYFANAGFDATLLDTSQEVLNVAKEIFAANELKATYVCGDALKMPFVKNTFDVVISIGLLEHFEDYALGVSEQIRVLKPGGLFIANIVPGKWSVQRLYRPVNFIFKMAHRFWSFVRPSKEQKKVKSKLYRSDYGSAEYIEVLKKLGCEDIFHSGMFPVPSLSYSPGFPFSPNHPVVERTLVFLWSLVLWGRTLLWPGRSPWLCSEWWGQHILVVARKPQ